MSTEIVFKNGKYSDGRAIKYKIIDMLTDSHTGAVNALVQNVSENEIKQGYYNVYDLTLNTEKNEGSWNKSEFLGFSDTVSLDKVQFDFYSDHLMGFLRKVEANDIINEFDSRYLETGDLEEKISERFDADFNLSKGVKSIRQLTDEATLDTLVDRIRYRESDISELDMYESVYAEFLAKEAQNIFKNFNDKKISQSVEITPESKIKDIYMKVYEGDEYGKELNPDLTFDALLIKMQHGDDFYKETGVADSIVRENVFELMSKCFKQDYDFFYDMWINNGKGFDEKVDEIRKGYVLTNEGKKQIRIDADSKKWINKGIHKGR